MVVPEQPSKSKGFPPLLLGKDEPKVELSYSHFQRARQAAAEFYSGVFDEDRKAGQINEKQVRKYYEQELISVDPHILQEIMPEIDFYQGNTDNVLITGETGTGKDVVARCLHFLSSRRSAPFCPLNCSVRSADILRSELFGYKKGAYTGATQNTPGLVDKAGGGTLFLDEIGQLSPELQSHLLRLLENREYSPVGGEAENKRSNARFIAATNQDLDSARKHGRFRDDLFFRFKARLVLEPLFLRPGDLPLLMYYFISRFNLNNKSSIRWVSRQALIEAMYYRWPGNVRELRDEVERACAVAQRRREPLASLNLLPHIPRYQTQNLAVRAIREMKSTGKRYLKSAHIDLKTLPTFNMVELMKQLDKSLDPEYQERWTLDERRREIQKELESGTTQEDLPKHELEEKPESDPFERICDLPADEVKKRYALKLYEKHGSWSAASKRANVRDQTLKSWAGVKSKKSR